MNRFFKALEARYQSKIEEGLAVLDLYLNKSVGVGEHPNIMEEADKALTMIEENMSKLETLRKLSDTEQSTNNP